MKLFAWYVILHWHEPGANFLCFVSTLQKAKTFLKSFCSTQISQKKLEKKKFTRDECLPNYYFSILRPKKGFCSPMHNKS